MKPDGNSTAWDRFERWASSYDRARRQLIPDFDRFYGSALDALPFEPMAEPYVLELGAGTGLFAALVRRRYPAARLRLVDFSEEMLSRARERFGNDERTEFVMADYSEAELGGPYDAIVSVLSIHHLGDDEKQALFRRAQAAIQAGGIFINADQVLGKSLQREADYHEAWLREVKAGGVSEADLVAALDRMESDRMATLADQLRWLEQAGFSDVQRLYERRRFAVYSGRKAAR